MNLLGGRYAPITEAIAFLEVGLSQVVEADQRWRAALGGYGFRPFDESFFGAKGVLVENTNIGSPARTETLQKAKSSHGLE